MCNAGRSTNENVPNGKAEQLAISKILQHVTRRWKHVRIFHNLSEVPKPSLQEMRIKTVNAASHFHTSSTILSMCAGLKNKHVSQVGTYEQ